MFEGVVSRNTWACELYLRPLDLKISWIPCLTRANSRVKFERAWMKTMSCRMPTSKAHRHTQKLKFKPSTLTFELPMT